ncbi:RimK family alpha-L-glutamate ligase [Micromonospora sp. NPDC048935]|uniref:ATP-grasp domain-containing protein n=1 Tax=Micromonospora sp. NPDC048935 TaxID=3364262 RepID=UPI003713FEE8
MLGQEGTMSEPTAVRAEPSHDPILLRGDRFQDRYRQFSVDYQNHFRDRLRSVPDEVPEPALVVFTNACDAEIDRLSLELGQAGFPMYRVDADECADLALLLDLAKNIMYIDGRLVRPDLLWIRQFSPNSVSVRSGDPVIGAYVRDQWAAVLEILREWPTTQVNPPDSRRTSRLGQLRLAAELGLVVPATVVGNNATVAAAALGCAPSKLVVKVNGDHFVEHAPGQVTGVFPRRVTLATGATTEPVPLMFQRYVPHDRELRVFSVGNELFGYEVRKDDPRDVWASPETVRVTPVEVPEGLRKQIMSMIVRTGLSFSGFDFLLPSDGEPVFLEYNVNGDWAWFERRASDDRVSGAAFRHFARLLAKP